MAALPLSHGEISDGAVLTALVGKTQTREYMIAADSRPLRVRVGASPLCTWQISAEEVMPEQFDLVWDGQTLSIEPLPSPLPIILNGQPSRMPTQVRVETTIEFGRAMLRISSVSLGRADNTGTQRKKSTSAELPSLHRLTSVVRVSEVATRRMFSYARELAAAAGRTTKTLELDVFKSQVDLSLLAEKPRLGKSGTPSIPPEPIATKAVDAVHEVGTASAHGASKHQKRASAPQPGPVLRALIGSFVLLVLAAATFLVRTHGLLPVVMRYATPLTSEAVQLANAIVETLRPVPAPLPPSAAPATAKPAREPLVKPPAVSVASPQVGDKTAAVFLFMGRLEDARSEYRALAARHPHAVYDTIVAVLEQTLAERCRSLSPAERSAQCAK